MPRKGVFIILDNLLSVWKNSSIFLYQLIFFRIGKLRKKPFIFKI